MAGTTLSQQYWFSDTYAIEDQHGIIEIRQPTASTTSGVQIRIHGTSYSSSGKTYNVRFVNANNTSNDYNFTYETVNSTDDKDFDSGWKTSTVSCSTGNDTFYVRIYCTGVVNKMYTLTGKVYWVNSSPPSTTYTKCSPPSSVLCGDGTNWYTPVYNTTASGASGSGTGKFYCKWNAGTAGQNTSIAGYTLKEDGSAYSGSTYTNNTNASTLQYYSSGWHAGAVGKTYKCTVKTRSTVSGYDSDYSSAYSSVKFSAVQRSVTLTLNANSGSVSPSSKTEYYGTTADLPTPTRTGYQFGGWYYNCTGSNSFNYQTGYKFTGSFSISLWTDATSYSSYATIFSCTEYGGISLCYESGTTGWRFYFYDGSYKSVTIPVAQVTAGYHTWCCVFNSSTKKIELFFDGVSKGTTSVSTTSCTWSSVNILVGAEPNSSNAAGTPYFTGKVGNIVITNDTTVRSPNPTSMSMPYDNSTVYAYWVPDVHHVTLDKQSGSGGTSSVNATYAAAMPSITVPTRTGYTFGGYYDATGGSGTQYYTAAGASARTWNKTEDTTLYANWTANTATIRYHVNGGTITTDTSATTRYRVSGNYVQRSTNSGSSWSNLTSTITSGVTTNYDFYNVTTYGATKDGSYYGSSTGNVTNASYRAQSATGTIISADNGSTNPATINKILGRTDSLVPTNGATYDLYINWVAKATYTISYNKGTNGTGTNTTATKTHGTALTLKGAIFTRSGYTQTGWATSDGGAQAYALSASYTANAAATLYPVWTANTYTVTVDLNGGTGGPGASFTATYGTNKSLTAPTRAGYDFVGWACKSGSRLSQDFSAATGFFTEAPTKYIWGGSGTNNSTIELVTMDTASGFPNSLKMITITEPGTSTRGIGFYRRATGLAENTNYLITFVAKAPLNTYFYIYNSTSYEGTGYTWEYLTPMAGTGNWQTYCIKLKTGTSITNNYTGYYVLCGDATTVNTSTCPGNISYNIAWTGIGTYTKFNAACTYVPADLSSDTIYALWIEKKYTISYNLNGGSLSSGTDTVRTVSSYKEAVNPLSAQWSRSPYALGTVSALGTGKPTANSPTAWFYVERPTKAASTSASNTTITTTFNATANGGESNSTKNSTKTVTTTTPQNFYSWTITGMDSSTHHYWGRSGTAVTTNSSQAFTSTSITLTAANNTGGVPTELNNLRQSAGAVTFTAGWTNGTATTATTYTSITFPAIPSHANTTATTARTVYYNANGGTGTTTAQSVSPTATVTYTANKWWTAQTSGGTSYSAAATITPTAAATYYARYTASTGSYNSPTIALRAALSKDSTSTAVTTTLTTSFSAASAVSAITSTKTVVTTQPYSFNKWAQGSASGSTTYSAGATFTPTAASVTFYATWTNGTATSATTYTKITLPTVPGKANTTATKSVTTSFSWNGAAGTSTTPTAKTSSATATVTWSDDDKWYTASSGGTGYAQGLTTYQPTASATLYAHYTASTGTYSAYSSITMPVAPTTVKPSDSGTGTVSFNGNSGTASTASITFTYTTSYKFGGWTTSSSGTSGLAAGATFTPTASATRYAAWAVSTTVPATITTASATKSATTASVTLTYNIGTGTTVSPSNVSYGVTVTWSGTGWYDSDSGGTKRADFNATMTPAVAGETVYAHWSESGRSAPSITLPVATKEPTTTTGTVVFMANGGSVSTGSTTYVITTSYTNNQWRIGSTSGTALGSAGAQVTAPTTSTTVYPTWNSSTSAASVVTPIPTRTGYVCTGWWSLPSGGTKVANAGSSFIPATTGTPTLYAQWSDAPGYYNGYRCCYVYNGSAWKKAVPYLFQTTLKQYIVTGDQVNVRMGPGLSYPSIGHVNTGDFVYSVGGQTVLGDGIVWLQTVGGHYISTEWLQLTSTTSSWVKTEPHVFTTSWH